MTLSARLNIVASRGPPRLVPAGRLGPGAGRRRTPAGACARSTRLRPSETSGPTRFESDGTPDVPAEIRERISGGRAGRDADARDTALLWFDHDADDFARVGVAEPVVDGVEAVDHTLFGPGHRTAVLSL